MNRHTPPINDEPQPEDIGLDPAMLAQALAEPTPDDLEQRVLALTDPQTLSLLDEALAPEAANAPEQLNDRILAATLPGYTSQYTEEQTPAVIGRITPASTWRYAAAAAIVLATGLGLWFINNQNGSTPHVADQNKANTSQTEIAEIDIPDASPALFAEVTSGIESDIQAVADSIQSIQDTTINQKTIWSEIEAYEQFVTDLESDFSSLPT